MLYVVQELTARLGAVTGKGYGELILALRGRTVAWISFAGLALAGLGAIATEFSGIAGLGDLFHVSRWVSLGLPVVLLVMLVTTGSYQRVERLSIAVGLFELYSCGWPGRRARTRTQSQLAWPMRRSGRANIACRSRPTSAR